MNAIVIGCAMMAKSLVARTRQIGNQESHNSPRCCFHGFLRSQLVVARDRGRRNRLLAHRNLRSLNVALWGVLAVSLRFIFEAATGRAADR